METGNFPVQIDNRDEDSGTVASGSGEIQPDTTEGTTNAFPPLLAFTKV